MPLWAGKTVPAACSCARCSAGCRTAWWTASCRVIGRPISSTGGPSRTNIPPSAAVPSKGRACHARAGCPPAEGELKWTATFWVHPHPFRPESYAERDVPPLLDPGDCSNYHEKCEAWARASRPGCRRARCARCAAVPLLLRLCASERSLVAAAWALLRCMHNLHAPHALWRAGFVQKSAG